MTEDPIHLYREGAISAPIAIARLLLSGQSLDAILARLDAEDSALRDLAQIHRDRLPALSQLVADAGIRHEAATIATIAGMFDRAVAAAPEASVAFYSLGDPDLLACATEEVIDWLVRESLVMPDRDIVDLGCGIGRIAGALAPLCRSVVGLDISSRMIAEARVRWPNVRFEITDGRDLPLPDASCDLILAVDVFPYLVQAGAELAASHVKDASRVLRADGSLVVLNVSYRGDPALDRRDLYTWARSTDLQYIQLRARPFRIWDADAFVLRKRP